MRLIIQSNSGIRPLKINFGSKSKAAEVIESYSSAKRSGALFPPSFRIVRDKTILQRDLLKTYHSGLDLRISNGETGLSIKYVNGVPRVVSDRSKNGAPYWHRDQKNSIPINH